MTLSVIMPIYNSEKYLKEAINSVLCQNGDFELILVDDGSKDNSLEICREFEKSDKRVKVIHTENHGVSHARNVGINEASGDYIEFLDSDDLLDATTFIKVFACIEDNHPDIIVFGLKTFGNNCDETLSYDFVADTTEKVSDAILELSRIGKIPSSVNKVYRKKFIGDIRFDETVSFAEDYLFNIELFYRVESICGIKDALYFYRKAGESLSCRFDPEAIKVTETIYRKNRKIFETFGILDFTHCEKAYAYSMTAVLNRLLRSNALTKKQKIQLMRKHCTDEYIELMDRFYPGTYTKLLKKRSFSTMYIYTKLLDILNH